MYENWKRGGDCTAPWRRDAKSCGVKTDGNPWDKAHHQGNSRRTRRRWWDQLHVLPAYISSAMRIEKRTLSPRGSYNKRRSVETTTTSCKTRAHSHIYLHDTGSGNFCRAASALNNAQHDAISCACRDSWRRFLRELRGCVRKSFARIYVYNARAFQEVFFLFPSSFIHANETK